MVIAPAKTGSESKSKKAVSKTDQTKRGIMSNAKPEPRMLIIVVIKLMEPVIDEIPAK